MNLQKTIENCVTNDSREQKALYEKYYGYCLKTVFRYVYHYDKAVDIVNDGYVKIFRNLSKFKYNDVENLEMILMGWMRMIMVNTAIDFLRKNNYMPEIGDLSEQVWQQEDKSQSSDQTLLYKDLIKEVKKLPPAYRVVFNMYVLDGFTHQEIGDRLGIAEGTSKSNLSKARQHLQKALKNHEIELDYAICK